MAEPDFKKDIGAFLSVASYPLVKYTDMTAETRDSAVDICMSAVEKFPSDLEKCTQVCNTPLRTVWLVLVLTCR